METQGAIKNLKESSAPGLDQISYQVVKVFPDELIKVLVNLYNAIFREDSFPEPWANSFVILIPKPQGNGVRPQGKIIYNRLIWITENNCIFLDSQTGFRPGRSCLDNLVSLANPRRVSKR